MDGDRVLPGSVTLPSMPSSSCRDLANSGVLEPACQASYSSSQACVQWCQVGSLKPALVRIMPAGKPADAVNHGTVSLRVGCSTLTSTLSLEAFRRQVDGCLSQRQWAETIATWPWENASCPSPPSAEPQSCFSCMFSIPQVQPSPVEPGILSSFKVNIIIMTLCALHRHSLLLAHSEGWISLGSFPIECLHCWLKWFLQGFLYYI